MRNQSFRTRMILLKGVLRRFFLFTFNRKYVNKSLQRRSGACARCGTCCYLTAHRGCPSLGFEPNGLPLCRTHNAFRMPNCIIFPIDERDIADRNLIAPPETPCGYTFKR